MLKQFKNLKALVFDLDGTIYEGERLIDGVLETINILRNRKFEIFFCTNNSTLTRKAISEKLGNLGIYATTDSIYSAAYAAACYLKKININRISLFGSSGLKEELYNAGLIIEEEYTKGEAFIIGLNTSICYTDMVLFSTLLDSRIPLIACNMDRWFPGHNGELKPGCGIMASLVESLLGRDIDFVIGKPNTLLLELLTERTGLKRDELLIIGDSYESDIVMANNYGSQSILFNSKDIKIHNLNSLINIKELPGII